MNKAFTSCAAAHFDFLEESPMIRSDASPIRPENALHICQSHAARVLINTCWAKVIYPCFLHSFFSHRRLCYHGNIVEFGVEEDGVCAKRG